MFDDESLHCKVDCRTMRTSQALGIACGCIDGKRFDVVLSQFRNAEDEVIGSSRCKIHRTHLVAQVRNIGSSPNVNR